MRRRPGRCRQRGQRNGGVHLHGAVRDQHRRDRRRRSRSRYDDLSKPHSQFPLADRAGSAAGRRLEPHRDADPVLRPDPALASAYAFVYYRVELLRLIAQMGLGAGALVVIGGTVAIVGFLTVTTGALVAVQGYNRLLRTRRGGPDRIRVGLFQRAADRTGDHRHRPVRHHRRRRHRTTRRHADQRGDRRARGHGYPQRRLSSPPPG